MKSDFTLFFYYESRRRVQNSFFLGLIKKLKEKVLNIYTEKNFKLINQLLLLFRVIIVNVVYFILYKATYLTVEVVEVITVVLFMMLLLIFSLALLNQNKTVVEDIEKNHYFRMLGDKRNNFLKEIMTERINRYVFYYLFPLTIGLALFVGVYSSINYILVYGSLLLLYRYLFQTLLYITQKLYFAYLRSVPVVDGILTYVFSGLSLSLITFLSFAPFFITNYISSSILSIVLYVTIELLFITLAVFVERKSKKKTMNYSVTNVIINKKTKKIKNNRMIAPHKIFRIFLGKDTFVNMIFLKDIYSVLRNKKQHFTANITVIILAFFYQIFFIAAMYETSELSTNLMVDSIIGVFVVLFFLTNFIALKNETFYSSEWIHLRDYKRLGYDKFSVYRAKKKTNYFIMYFYLLSFVISSVISLFTFDVEVIIHAIVRIGYYYLLFTLIIDYHLIEDVKNNRVYTSDPVSGIGGFNFAVLLFGVFGIGFNYLLINIENVTLVVIVFILLLIILKIINRVREQKLRGSEII